MKQEQLEKEVKALRKDSFSYTLKSLKALIIKLEKNEWADKEELEQLRKLHLKMVNKYIGLELNI